MELDLHPSVVLARGTLGVLIAPEEFLISALNNNLELQRFKILFVSGNYSRILTRLNRRITEMDVRRAFTAFQLLTILEEDCHTVTIIEYDPILFKEADGMQDYLARAMRDVAGRSIVLLYSPGLDLTIEYISSMADRVFYFDRGESQQAQRRRMGRYRSKPVSETQTSLGEF